MTKQTLLKATGYKCGKNNVQIMYISCRTLVNYCTRHNRLIRRTLTEATQPEPVDK